MARGPLLRALTKALRTQSLSDRVPNPGRRDFIKKSSAAVGLAFLPGQGLLTRNLWASSLDSSAHPVVIIGAGLAGLTTAYRLARAGIRSVIYEVSPRLGGRVLTKDRFNSEGMFCELGGELIDTSHKEIVALANELGITVQELDKGDDGLEDQVFYFDGTVRFQRDLNTAAAQLARVLQSDIEAVFGRSQERQVDYRNHNAAAARIDNISLSDYLRPFRGEVENWVLDLIEAGYMSEYGLDPEDQSALNLLTLIEPNPGKEFNVVGDSDETHRILGGNSRLVEGLAKAIKGHATVQLERRLVRISDSGNSLELTFEKGSATEIVKPSRVVCTIPFSTLRMVEGLETLGLSPVKLKAIRETGYGTNSKQMLGFTGRPWRQAIGKMPACSGYAFTDLSTQVFWDTSRAQKGKSGILTAYLAGTPGAGPQPDPRSHLPNFEKVFPGLVGLFDGNMATSHWAASPFVLGSYACPRVGQWTTLIGSAGEAELGGRLLFAGEHTSIVSQGFMNGAVETGNQAAARIIG